MGAMGVEKNQRLWRGKAADGSAALHDVEGPKGANGRKCLRLFFRGVASYGLHGSNWYSVRPATGEVAGEVREKLLLRSAFRA